MMFLKGTRICNVGILARSIKSTHVFLFLRAAQNEIKLLGLEFDTHVLFSENCKRPTWTACEKKVIAEVICSPMHRIISLQLCFHLVPYCTVFILNRSELVLGLEPLISIGNIAQTVSERITFVSQGCAAFQVFYDVFSCDILEIVQKRLQFDLYTVVVLFLSMLWLVSCMPQHLRYLNKTIKVIWVL